MKKQTEPNPNAGKHEPILMFTAVREKFLRHGRLAVNYGTGFYIAGDKKPAAQQVVEQEAQRVCAEMNVSYGEKHVVVLPDKVKKIYEV